MIIKEWRDLPPEMQTREVRPYWKYLKKHESQLMVKRMFDIAASMILLFILAGPMFVISLLIKLDSKGPVIFKQERVTAYGKVFTIYKFRTMRTEIHGASVTSKNDDRITKIGRILRKYRMDEFPQLLNVLMGDMTFVGTRPEVLKYVNMYDPKYYATLLLPAGITSETSIQYKDEERLLDGAEDVDKVYVEKILPEKMKINLNSIRHFSLISDMKTMIRTVTSVLR